MERQFALRIAQFAAIALLVLLFFFNIKQVDHLERLVVEGNSRVTELERSVQRLREDLSSGELQASQGTRPDEHPHQRYFEPDEWEALHAPGNLLEPPTDSIRGVAGGQSGGLLRRSFITDIPSLNPLTVNSMDVAELYHYVGDGLAGRERSNPERFVPGLAYRIEANDDFTEFRIFLKRGVRWHPPAVDTTSEQYAWLDGDHEVVADDFVFGLELIMNEQVEAASLRNYFNNCEGIEVVNDHEFIVRWSESEYTNITATIGLGPLPRWLYGFDEDGEPFDEATLGREFNEHWYNERAIGTGPFRFVRWEQGGAIRIERFNDYHGERPWLDAIEFRIIGDATARLNELRAGNLDYIPIEPTEYKNEILEGGTPEFETGELQHEEYMGTAYRYLGWNQERPWFGDRRVRLAMTHAFNRELTIERNMNGLGQILTGPILPNNPGYDTSLEPYPFDLERAAALLDEAGWVDRNDDGIREKVVEGRSVNFEFNMMTYGYRPEMIAAMEVYRSDLRRIGIVMNIQPVEWSVMLQRLYDQDFDAYTGGWALAWETDFYQIWHSSQADEPRSSNRIGFRNDEADEIIETLRRTFDEDERTELVRRFHRLVYEEQPYTFWFQMRSVGAWSERVHNVSFSPLRPSDSSMDWFLSPAN